jgi:ABC-type branched-subunit amino acid transport system substrate-binding protein
VLTERVKNNYEKYKYFFKYDPPSESDLAPVARDTVVALREYTGFNKLAYISADSQMWNSYIENAIEPLAELDGFELVYGGRFPPDVLDFSSYFAAAEAAGAEILFPVILGTNGIRFINEWYDRQSPMVLWGVIAAGTPKDVWEITDGKCEHVAIASTPQNSGYPITSKTLPMQQDYLERWDKIPSYLAVSAYDIIRFVLPDALERAGTLETETVIEALEEINVETSSTGHFAISADSHEILFGPGYATQFCFQWQADGKFVPVYPRDFKEQEGVPYTFPDWPGPWDNIN